MDNFTTKVNVLKIRFLCFKANLIFLLSNLSKKGEQGKTNLITLLIMKIMPSYIISMMAQLTKSK
jgi:hypothetical protein